MNSVGRDGGTTFWGTASFDVLDGEFSSHPVSASMLKHLENMVEPVHDATFVTCLEMLP